jgi:hypothetical protein
MVSKGNHPQMALFQVSELLQFTQIYGIWRCPCSSTGFNGARLCIPDTISAYFWIFLPYVKRLSCGCGLCPGDIMGDQYDSCKLCWPCFPISYLSKDLLPFVSNWMPDSVAQKLHFHAPLFWPNSQLWPSFEAKSLWPKCRCLTYGMIIKFVHGKHMSIARGYPHFKLVKSCPWPYSLFLWGTPAFHRRIPFMTTSIHSPFLFIRAKTMTRKLRSQAAACPSCSNAYLRGSQLTGGNSLTPQIRRFPVKNGRVHQQKMRVLSIKWY